MIKLYSGTPGSGKSLHMARDILNRCRMGKPVIANFSVKLPEKKRYSKAQFEYWHNDYTTPERLIEYSREYFKTHKFREGAILWCCDECQLVFNAREWQKSGRSAWLSFFTQHRHYGYNIILVAQFDRMIDRQIRSLIEYEVVHRKVSNFGTWGKVLAVLLGGNVFVAVTSWYPLRERLDSEFIRARKSLYSIYDSYGILDESPVPPLPDAGHGVHASGRGAGRG